MPFYIRDARAVRLARQLAKLKGTTLTRAVITALEQALAREIRPLGERIAEIASDGRRLRSGRRGRSVKKNLIDELWGNASPGRRNARVTQKLTRRQSAELKALAALPDDAINVSDAPEHLDWSKARRGVFYRSRGADLDRLYEKGLRLYRTRILDNLDLDRLPDLKARAAVVARALIDRGDARAFAMGREMLDLLQALAD